MAWKKTPYAWHMATESTWWRIIFQHLINLLLGPYTYYLMPWQWVIIHKFCCATATLDQWLWCVEETLHGKWFKALLTKQHLTLNFVWCSCAWLYAVIVWCQIVITANKSLHEIPFFAVLVSLCDNVTDFWLLHTKVTQGPSLCFMIIYTLFIQHLAWNVMNWSVRHIWSCFEQED